MAAIWEPDAELRRAAAAGRTLVFFRAGSCPFAIPAGAVEAVIPLRAVAQPPGAGRGLAGVMPYRGSALVLADARVILGLEETKAEPARFALVLHAGVAGKVGLMVDGVDRVRRVAEAAIGKVPPLLLRGRTGEASAPELCRVEGDQNRDPKLVPVLDPGHLFDTETLDAVEAATEARGREETCGHAAAAAAQERVLVFKAGGAVFAFPASAIAEVRRRPARLGHLPGLASPLLEGVLSWRGRMLPVVDGAARLGRSGAGWGRFLLILASGEAALSVDALPDLRAGVASAAVRLPPVGAPFASAFPEGDGAVAVLDAASLTAGLEEDLARVVAAAANTGHSAANGGDGKTGSDIAFGAGQGTKAAANL